MRNTGALVLAVETSCDETAVAVMRGPAHLLASEVASQIALHRPHGGVVPEIASRSHLDWIEPVIEEAVRRADIELHDVELVAATSGPGLASSLLVGYSAAKGMALGLRVPFLAINHLEGHLLSPFFGKSQIPPHCVGLIVSGGHTSLIEMRGCGIYRVMGRTLDDAAGEAFDKVGKLLGLPYPGGPEIDRLARQGDAAAFNFPRSMMQRAGHDFSFSGLKTAVRYMLPSITADRLPDVCAAFQEAVVDVLVGKCRRALRDVCCHVLAVSGGVSCNERLRTRLAEMCAAEGIELHLAEPKLSTDNAAMIAYAAVLRLGHGDTTPFTADIDPNRSFV